jgi:hypothetical protein
MTRREQVILGLTATAALGAGGYLAIKKLSPPASGPPTIPIDFNTLITSVQVKLKQGELTEREERILVAATTPWLRDPLRERQVETRAPTEAITINLPRYIGYLNVGSKAIAIIDGDDYRVGEMIEGGLFQLTRIDPEHIELTRPGDTDPIKVPLEQVQTTESPE